MTVNLGEVFKEIEKRNILDGIKAFTFLTKTGKLRRYEKVENGWLKCWNGIVETDELTVKIVFLSSRKDKGFIEK